MRVPPFILLFAVLVGPYMLSGQNSDFSGVDSFWSNINGVKGLQINSDSSLQDTTRHSGFKRFNKYVQGKAQVEYQYHEGNYPGQNVPKHLFRYSIQPELIIAGFPVRLNMGYASDYLGQVGNLYQLNFRFDQAKYRRLLFERGQKELNERWGRCDTLMDILKLKVDSLPSLDTLNLQLTGIDSLLVIDSLSIDQDSLLNLDSLRRVHTSLLSKKEELSRLLSLIDKLNEYRLLLSKKRSELAAIRSKRSLFGSISNRWSRKLNLESFEVGSYSVSSGKYFAKSGQLFGLSSEIAWNALHLHVFGGQAVQLGNFLRSDQRGQSNSFRFIGSGLKLGNNRTFIQTYYTLGESRLKEGFGESDFMVFPDRNSVVSTQAQLGLTKALSIYSELNFSQSTRYNSSTLGSEQRGTSVNEDNLFNNSALLIGAQLNLEKRELNIDLSASQVGDGYFSYLNPYLRKDIRQVELKLNKSLFHSRVRWAATASLSEDNVGQSKSATTRMERMTNTFVFNLRKGPVITLTNSLVGIRTQVREIALNRNLLVSASVLNMSKVWLIKNWKASYTSVFTWVNTSTFFDGEQVMGMNSLSKNEMLQFQKFQVSVGFKVNRIRENWTELAQEIGVGGNLTKRLKIIGEYGFQRNLLYQSTRDLYRLKGLCLISNHFNVEGRVEYQSFRQSTQSLVIGSLKLQVVW